jgi:soluble lytic murein transglycosylase-like protein
LTKDYKWQLGWTVFVSFLLIFCYYLSLTEITCDPKVVQITIIEDTRPKMGQFEKEMWQKAIAKSALKNKLPADILTAKIAVESNFKGHVEGPMLRSGVRAKGASQLMPMWIKGFDPFEIEANIDKGAEVLAYERDRAKGDIYVALQKYNGTGKETIYYADAIYSRVHRAQQRACNARINS